MSETHEEERAPSPTPPTCLQCHDQGWWYDEVTGFNYCGCRAGAKAEEEDGDGSD